MAFGLIRPATVAVRDPDGYIRIVGRRATDLIKSVFGKSSAEVEGVKPVKTLRADLERKLGPRDTWNTPLLRELFGALLAIWLRGLNNDVYFQIGLVTLVYQVTASLFQPLVGLYTDKRPLPYALACGMGFTLIGLVLLSTASTFGVLLAAAAIVGLGSSVFHPESSRVARLASGGRHGFAQALFQVGGNAGTAIGPLAAAFIVLPYGQHSVACSRSRRSSARCCS